MSCRGEERELGGGSASETEALSAGAAEEARQGHDKSLPRATAVVAVRIGEAEAGRPGRRLGSWGTSGGGRRGSFLVKRAWLGPWGTT